MATVKKMLEPMSTQQVSKLPPVEREKAALDLDKLYEYNLKIFGDVFESLIGAVYLDC